MTLLSCSSFPQLWENDIGEVPWGDCSSCSAEASQVWKSLWGEVLNQVWHIRGLWEQICLNHWRKVCNKNTLPVEDGGETPALFQAWGNTLLLTFACCIMWLWSSKQLCPFLWVQNQKHGHLVWYWVHLLLKFSYIICCNIHTYHTTTHTNTSYYCHPIPPMHPHPHPHMFTVTQMNVSASWRKTSTLMPRIQTARQWRGCVRQSPHGLPDWQELEL